MQRMKPIPVGQVADIISIIAGFMTIAGIGGILSWSLMRRSRGAFEQKTLDIFSHSVKLFLWLLLLIPILYGIGLAKDWFFGFLRDSVDLRTGGRAWWDGRFPLAYIGFYAAILLFCGPLWILGGLSIFRMSLQPFSQFWRKFTSRHRKG
jgi:hypothetical protein